MNPIEHGLPIELEYSKLKYELIQVIEHAARALQRLETGQPIPLELDRIDRDAQCARQIYNDINQRKKAWQLY